MKRFAVVSGICASFVLGAALCAVAQDEHPSERPPNAPQEPKAAQPAQRPEQPEKPEQARQPERQQDQGHHQQPARPDDRQAQQPASGNRKDTTPQSEGRQPQDQQSGDRHMQGRETNDNGRTYEGRPENGQQQADVKHGGEHRRIPDNDFHSHFGREHRFAVGHVQQYQGRPSFAYGGYTFALVDAWPTGWGYDSDDYYVDYVDGDYWLYNTMYPGVRVMVIIVG